MSPGTPPPPPPSAKTGTPPPLVYLVSAEVLGRTVRAAREARGMSKAEVTRTARVGRRFLTELEEGKQSAQLEKVLAVMITVGMVAVMLPIEALQEAGR